jgi:hypothetical protein
MINLDFSKNRKAQDMIAIIMKEKKLSPEDALKYAINIDIYNEILNKGYGCIALDMWHHFCKLRKLDDAIFKVDFDKHQEEMISDIEKHEKVDTETSICYFLIFTMDALGYHI